MSNHAHLWHGSEQNYRKIRGLNDDLIHIALSILFSQLNEPWTPDPGPQEADELDFEDEEGPDVSEESPDDIFWDGALNISDILFVLLENDSHDARTLAYSIAGLKYPEPLQRGDSIAYIASGIMRVVEDRIRGDGTALYRACKKNPYPKKSRYGEVWDMVEDGTYWTQAVLMGIDRSTLANIVNSGFLVSRHRAVDDRGSAGRRSYGVNRRRPHAPPP